jgi:hypothetical protein
MPYQLDAHVIAFVKHQRRVRIAAYPLTFKPQYPHDRG